MISMMISLRKMVMRMIGRLSEKYFSIYFLGDTLILSIDQVGCFDPYSDDPRLAIKKVTLCPFTGTLIIAGTAGHLMVVKLKNQETPPAKIKVSLAPN